MEDMLPYPIVKKGNNGYDICEVVHVLVTTWFDKYQVLYPGKRHKYGTIWTKGLDDLIDALRENIQNPSTENHYVKFSHIYKPEQMQIKSALKDLPFCFDEEDTGEITAELIRRYFDIMSDSQKKPWYNIAGKSAFLASLRI